MNSRKILGLFVSIIFLLIIWISSLIWYKELLDIIAPDIIRVLPFILVVFIGGNAVDKFTKSKFYKKELDNDKN